MLMLLSAENNNSACAKIKTSLFGGMGHMATHLVTGLPAAAIGEDLFTSCGVGLLGSTMVANLIGGAIVGAFALPLLVDSNFRLYSYVQKLAPILPLAVNLSADLVGDLITSASGSNCKDDYYTSIRNTECQALDTFLSCNGRANIVGDAILTTGLTLFGYACYKGYKYFNHQAPVAVEGVPNPQLEGIQVEREPGEPEGEVEGVSYRQLEGESPEISQASVADAQQSPVAAAALQRFSFLNQLGSQPGAELGESHVPLANRAVSPSYI